MASLDGQRIFDGTVTIEAESIERQSIERSAAGLDGVVSIDMGGRGRRIRQSGELRAASRAEMRRQVDAIAAFVDGRTHTLAADTGEVFEDVRVDSVKVRDERMSGAAVTAGYEIVYRQL